MSLFLLAIFSLLFIYVWWGEETRDDPDPGYGTEHMGAHMLLGPLALFMVVDLIYIAFTDIINFLVAVTTMGLVGFVGFFVFEGGDQKWARNSHIAKPGRSLSKSWTRAHSPKNSMKTISIQ